MHILITGAAGMIGRKLTARLVKDGGLNGKPIDQLTLTDIVAPEKPAGLCRQGRARRPATSPRPAPPKSWSRQARRDLPSRRRRVGRGRDRFREGLSRQSRRHARPARGDPPAGGGYKPKVVFTSSIAVFGAPFPHSHPRRFPSDAAHLLRHAEGDQRIAARRLHAARLSRRRRHPPADDLRAARQAEQGGVRLLLRHHPRAARRPGSDAAGRRHRAPHPCQPALGGRLPDPCRGADARAARPAHQPHDAGRLLHRRRADRGAAPYRRRQGRRAHPARAGRTGHADRRGLAERFDAKRAARSASRRKPRSTRSSAPISRTNWAARSPIPVIRVKRDDALAPDGRKP